MILYISIIAICMIIISALNIIFATSLPALYVILSTCLFTLSQYVVDLIIGGLLFVMPKKWFNPFSKFYKIYGFERKFYEKLLIRKWKDKIPYGKGPIGIGFAKDKVINPKDNKYILFFLQDSCQAETMHILSLIGGFSVLLFAPTNLIWNVALPVILVNAFLQALPILVQRYNRPKMITLYNRNLNQLQTA